VALEREVQQKTDRRGEGWRVYLELRRLRQHLDVPVARDEPGLLAYVTKAKGVISQRMAAMEEGNLFNRISVEIAEMSELDLFVLQKHLASEDHQVRLEAVSAVGELGYQGALPSLLELLAREQHLFVLSKLTKVLGQVGGAAVMGELLPYLSHEDDRVRANTIEGLESIPGDDKFIHIMPMLEDPAPRVRANALKAIKALGGERFTSMLRTMIRHPEFDHRRSALFVLQAMQNDFGRDCLVVMLDDHHPELRGRALDLLARRTDMPTVEGLVKLIRSGPGEATRERALEVLRTIQAAAPPEVAAAVAEQLRRLAEPEAEPEPEATPATPVPVAPDPAAGTDSGSFKAGGDIKKVMARMSTLLSGLEPRERREAENLIKSGKIQNESQLKTVIARSRNKKGGR
jgi:hypothetical protein